MNDTLRRGSWPALLACLLAWTPASAQVVIEGESLVASVAGSDGPVSAQNMQPFGAGWSGGAQLFWRAPNPTDTPVRSWPSLRFSIQAPAAGAYRVVVYHTQAPDYGNVRMFINGGESVHEIVGFASSVRRARSVVNSVNLKAGANPVVLTVFRRLPGSKASFFGLDAIELSPVSPGPVSPSQSVGLANVGTGPSAALTFAALGPKMSWDAMGPTETDLWESGLETNLVWTSAFDSRFEWRYQVATVPFAPQNTLTPAGLVADGPVSAKAFPLDFGSFPPLGTKTATLKGSATTVVALAKPATNRPTGLRSGSSRPPLDLYVRLVPLSGGNPGGPPSNVIVAHIKPGTSPTRRDVQKSFEQAGKVAAMAEQVNGYSLTIVSFTPPEFPTSWGCVKVLENPYTTTIGHPVAQYKPREEPYCPEKKDDSKSWLDWVGLALQGWLFAYDQAAKVFNNVKGMVASEFAKAVPCSMLGKSAGSACQSFVKEASSAALSYGMAAVGIPPTIPDIAALQATARGEILGAAADFTCEQVVGDGGTCGELAKQKLVELYGKGLDSLQKEFKHQGLEPSCGDTKTASELGLEPLPCFSKYPGMQIEPAKSSVYQPPVAKIRVTRTKAVPDFAPSCRLHLSLEAKNYFKGGQIPGIASPPIPAKPLMGELFEPEIVGVPTLGLGESTELTVAMTRFRLFNIVGTGGTLTEWYVLYHGATATLKAGTQSTEPEMVSFLGKQPPCSQPGVKLLKFQ